MVVVFRGWSNLPPRFVVQDPVGSVYWIYMGNSSFSRWGKKDCVVIKFSRNMEMCRYMGVKIGLVY